jgi:ornithine cyclodeaminase/alanine dehydrogenase-like protein (mu-crystallin family)
MVRYIKEEDVRRILTMPGTIALMEQAFRDWAQGNATDVPRRRLRQPTGPFSMLMGAAPALNVLGFKATYNRPTASSALVQLYDQQRGNLIAMIECDWMGRMRTGATTGLATRLLSRVDASVVACFGTGRHGATQLEGVCAVRKIREVRAFGRNPERVAKFCDKMSHRLNVSVHPVVSPHEAISGAHIINVMTRAQTPVFDGKLLTPGQHVNAAGINAIDRREIDLETIRRSSVVVVDSRQVAQNESGDLLPAFEAGLLQWESLPDLGDILLDRRAGRTSPDQITLFESHGMCIEDLYTGKHVLEVALRENIGTDLPIGE